MCSDHNWSVTEMTSPGSKAVYWHCRRGMTLRMLRTGRAWPTSSPSPNSKCGMHWRLLSRNISESVSAGCQIVVVFCVINVVVCNTCNCFHHSTALTERSKLLADTHHLKQQNSELRMLLHQYQLKGV